MTTAFEFLEREERRIALPVSSAIAALAASVLAFSVLAWMSVYSKRLESEYTASAIAIENDSKQFLELASGMLPPEARINELEAAIQKHNLAIGGVFSVWTRLFNSIETSLPTGAIITAVENPFTGKAVFAAEDRFFRFRIAVTDPDHANAFYLKLSENHALENLNFVPKGEIKFQGKTAFSIEIEFKFNDAV
ncbi:MAG TPA: hypothetical protein PLK28_04000 [Candidatus Rifleibacterium sp.]|nr:hypothetical protein [Candidatus Rifleibacterium sp.]